jgi:phosphate transport system substrate-binding protein
MTRIQLLGAAAIIGAPTWALAQNQPPITGGGATTNNPPYPLEFSKFNPGGKAQVPLAPLTPRTATFAVYFEPGSGVAQQAFLTDDLSCDMGHCGSGGTVSYAASDITFDADQITSWATSSVGQTAAGNLIQLPSMGVGVAIPVVNAAITENGALTLSDSDLCGVFSGRITDFSQITDSITPPTQGTILVAYATDNAGSTFWLTNHLAAVCNAATGDSAFTFTATTNFASLFPGQHVPNNFAGATDGQGVASLLASCSGTVAVTSALGYVEPSYTEVDPDSQAVLNGPNCEPVHSPLVAAAVFTAINRKPTLPTYAAIATGLTHPAIGIHLKPPTNPSQGADPTSWVPIVQTVKAGYPLVGYTTWDYAQCYMGETGSPPHSPVGFALDAFLRLHFGIGTEPNSKQYPTAEHANGNATLVDTKANGLLKAIIENILTNTNVWNTDIDNANVCPELPGR